LDEIWGALITPSAAGPGRFWARQRESEAKFLCEVNNNDFTDFRSAKFHEICTQDVDR